MNNPKTAEGVANEIIESLLASEIDIIEREDEATVWIARLIEEYVEKKRQEVWNLVGNDKVASPEDCVVISREMFKDIVRNLKTDAVVKHISHWKCVYCQTSSALRGNFPHEDNCLIALALALLEDK